MKFPKITDMNLLIGQINGSSIILRMNGNTILKYAILAFTLHRQLKIEKSIQLDLRIVLLKSLKGLTSR